MARPTKRQLLDHYESRQPNQFFQIDAFDDLEETEEVKPDPDGHTIYSCETYELMAGSTVRVLVRPGTPKDTVLKLLEKIRDQIEAYQNQDRPPQKVKH